MHPRKCTSQRRSEGLGLRDRRTATIAGEEEVEDAVGKELHPVAVEALFVEHAELARTLIKLAQVALCGFDKYRSAP